MNLSKKTIKTIVEATNLASTLQIEGLIFDADGIRGYNDEEGVILASLKEYDFEFESLGLSRLQNLKNKFMLLKGVDKFSVEAVPKKKNPDIIEKLHFDCDRVDFDFRCALPKTITDIPKKSLNTNAVFSFVITEDDVNYITQGIASMRAANMTIQGTSKVVRFRFSDDTGDILNYKLDTELEINGEDDTMSLTINVKKMLPIFRIAAQEGNFTLNILKNNIVYVSVNGLDILVMSEV